MNSPSASSRIFMSWMSEYLSPRKERTTLPSGEKTKTPAGALVEMLPSVSTTTLPGHGPITDLPSGPRPQPGTVSNVIRPHPIRTGWGVSAATVGRARPKTRTRATEVEWVFTNRAPGGVDVGAGWGFTPGPGGRLDHGNMNGRAWI